MKPIILFACVAACLVFAHADDRLEKVKKAREECQLDPATRLDKEEIRKAINKEPYNDATFGPHARCVNQKLGIQKPNGEVCREVLKLHLATAIQDQAKLEAAVNDCAVNQSTPEETAKKLFDCMRKYIPLSHGQQV